MDEESRKYVLVAGRQIGHAQAVTAAYEVLEQYKGDEHHDEYMAVMAVISAIHALDKS